MAEYKTLLTILLYFCAVNICLSEENLLINSPHFSSHFLEKLPTEINDIILEYVGYKDLDSRLAFEQVSHQAKDLVIGSNNRYYRSDYIYTIIDSARHLYSNFFHFIKKIQAPLSFEEKKPILELMQQIKLQKIIDFHTGFDDFYIDSELNDIEPEKRTHIIKNLIKNQQFNQIRDLLIQKEKKYLIEKYALHFTESKCFSKKSYILDVIKDNLEIEKNLDFQKLIKEGMLLKMGPSYFQSLGNLIAAVDENPKTLKEIQKIYVLYREKIRDSSGLEEIERLITEIRNKIIMIDRILVQGKKTSFGALKKDLHTFLNQKYNSINNRLEEICWQEILCKKKINLLLKIKQQKIEELTRKSIQKNVSENILAKLEKQKKKLVLLGEYKKEIFEIFEKSRSVSRMSRYIYYPEDILKIIDEIEYQTMIREIPSNLKKFLIPKLFT